MKKIIEIYEKFIESDFYFNNESEIKIVFIIMALSTWFVFLTCIGVLFCEIITKIL